MCIRDRVLIVDQLTWRKLQQAINQQEQNLGTELNLLSYNKSSSKGLLVRLGNDLPLSKPTRVREKHFSLSWPLVKGTRFWERDCYSLFSFFLYTTGTTFVLEQKLLDSRHLKRFGTRFVLVLTRKYESGSKKGFQFTSRIRNVVNPESEAETLYSKLVVPLSRTVHFCPWSFQFAFTKDCASTDLFPR